MNHQAQLTAPSVTYLKPVQQQHFEQSAELLTAKAENIELRRKNAEIHEQLILQGHFQADRDATTAALEHNIRALKQLNQTLRGELSSAQTQCASSKLAQIRLRHASAVARREVADLKETNEKLQVMLDLLVAEKNRHMKALHWLLCLAESTKHQYADFFRHKFARFFSIRHQ